MDVHSPSGACQSPARLCWCTRRCMILRSHRTELARPCPRGARCVRSRHRRQPDLRPLDLDRRIRHRRVLLAPWLAWRGRREAPRRNRSGRSARLRADPDVRHGMAGGLLSLFYLAARRLVHAPSAVRPRSLIARALRVERWRIRRGDRCRTPAPSPPAACSSSSSSPLTKSMDAPSAQQRNPAGRRCNSFVRREVQAQLNVTSSGPSRILSTAC